MRTPSDYAHTLKEVPMVATQERDLRMVLSGELDIFWSATSIEREQLVEPVRVPHFPGITGLASIVCPSN